MSKAFDNLSKVVEKSEKEMSDIKTGQADSGNQLNMLMSLMPILKADIGEEGNIMEYLKSLMGGNLDLSSLLFNNNSEVDLPAPSTSSSYGFFSK